MAELTRSISFEINRDYTKSLPKIIETNFEEMKAFLTEQTKKDYEVVVNKDNFLESKERCTLLKKQIDLLDSERKSIKNEYLKPYNEFENQCKELISIISNARDSIWGQVTTIEDNYDETRKNALKTEFEQNMGEYIGLRSFEKIWDKKWLTKAKENTCHKELLEKVNDIKKEIDTISSVSGEYKTAMLANYSNGMDFADIMILLEKCKEIGSKYDTEKDTPFETSETNTYTLSFQVSGTQEQLIKLREYLRTNNIKFNKI